MEGVESLLSGQGVLITGGTGFVGTALVEKLLRSVPDLGKIYLLVRARRGVSPQQRVQQLASDPVFTVLKENGGEAQLGKLQAVEGDVSQEGLGLSPQDRQTLIKEVNFVFHSAATLDFEADLKTTVDINLLGTKRVLDLCHEITNLKGMVHVSSAYVNSHMHEPKEKLYPVHKSSDELISLVKSLTDEELEKETSVILGDYLNTYTFTKALAEHEVAAANSAFPTCIVRPSMITAAWKEPVRGWTISKNGPQGFLMGALKGVVRRLPVDTSIVCDYIPVDIVVNGLIAAAWDIASTRKTESPIYQVTSSSHKPFRWSMVTDIMLTSLHRYPLRSAVWYPYLKFIPSMLWFRLTVGIFHILPAYILDFVTLISGGRPILMKLHRNIGKSLDKLEPFIFTEWVFDNSQTLKLLDKLPGQDKETFNLSLASINWEEYFDNLTQGVRMFLHKEKPSSLSAARKKDNILGIANMVLQGCFLLLVWYIIALVCRTTLTSTVWFAPILLIVYSFI